MPLRLARVEGRAATDAVLLLPAEAAALADAVARCDEPPAVHRVRGGFLLVPRQPPMRPLPGLPLRRLAGDFYVPVDASPRPALLPDELVGLTRDGGLILLPHGPPLSFDAADPLPPSAWLRVDNVRRGDWRRFVEPPLLADRLTVIEKPSPPAALVEILGDQPDGALSGKGQPGAVPDDARPASGSFKNRIIGGASMGVASALAGLGKLLGSGALARLGAKLAKQAIDRVPRLTEKIFGEQEAALREVLRQLQSGDVERGLRRAPIAVGDPSTTGRVDSGSRLADRDPRFSLSALLGGGGGGAAWLGGGDVWLQLAAEYRRLANEAVQRGDFRRAAYLHGVLLRDVRTAANVLAAGGLHRDAARLYRDKLNDPVAAAQAFDRAGDHDEAVRLYLKHDMEVSAADLLRRIGEEDQAIGLYRRAAERLAARGSHLAAGDLIRRKVGDRDRAKGFYTQGWLVERPEAIECGQRLLDEHLLAEDWAATAAQFDDAEARLGPHEAGKFFNYALGLGDDFLPRERRIDLEDRTRLLFAKQLRTGSGRVMDLFVRSETWPPGVVRDATVASQPARPSQKKDHPPTDKPIHVASGTVRAVALSRDSRDLVVATTEAVVCWRLDSDKVFPIATTSGRTILGVSIDPNAWVVYVLFREDTRAYLQCFQLDDAQYQARGRYELPGIPGEVIEHRGYHLQANAANYFGELQVTASVDGSRITLAGVYLKPVKPVFGEQGEETTSALIVNGADLWDWNGFIEFHLGSGTWSSRSSPWFPAVPRDGSLAVVAIDWHSHQDKLIDVAGLSSDGGVQWSRFVATEPNTLEVRRAAGESIYVAVCMEGPGLVVAATKYNVIRWLRVDGTRLVPCHPERKLDVPARVAFLAHRPHRREFVALLEDGTAVRFTR